MSEDQNMTIWLLIA